MIKILTQKVVMKIMLMCTYFLNPQEMPSEY